MDNQKNIYADALPYPYKPVGIGGWLKFFIWGPLVIFNILFAIQGVIEINKELSRYVWAENLENFFYLATFFMCLFGIGVAVRAHKSRLKSTRIFIVVSLWVMGPLSVLIIGGATYSFFPSGVPISEEVASMFFTSIAREALVSAVPSFVWTLYFTFSKRVANTYRKTKPKTVTQG